MGNNTAILLRNDTAANWTSDNPTLAAGEMGFETDTNKFKFGDGSTAWNSLAYVGAGASFKYGLYTLSARQTSNFSVGDHIEFDTDEGSLGGLSTGSGQENGIITLPAGKTYKITFGLNILGSSTSQSLYQIYNRTSSAYIGMTLKRVPINQDTHYAGAHTAITIFTTSTETEIDLRITDTDISYIEYIGSFILIEEYGGY